MAFLASTTPSSSSSSSSSSPSIPIITHLSSTSLRRKSRQRPCPPSPPSYTKAQRIVTPFWQCCKNPDINSLTQHEVIADITSSSSPRNDAESSVDEDISDHAFALRHRRAFVRRWKKSQLAASRKTQNYNEANLKLKRVSVTPERKMCVYNYETENDTSFLRPGLPDKLVRIVKGPGKWIERISMKNAITELDFERVKVPKSLPSSRVRLRRPRVTIIALQKWRRLRLTVYQLNLLRHLAIRRKGRYKHIPGSSRGIALRALNALNHSIRCLTHNENDDDEIFCEANNDDGDNALRDVSPKFGCAAMSLNSLVIENELHHQLKDCVEQHEKKTHTHEKNNIVSHTTIATNNVPNPVVHTQQINANFALPMLTERTDVTATTCNPQQKLADERALNTCRECVDQLDVRSGILSDEKRCVRCPFVVAPLHLSHAKNDTFLCNKKKHKNDDFVSTHLNSGGIRADNGGGGSVIAPCNHRVTTHDAKFGPRRALDEPIVQQPERHDSVASSLNDKVRLPRVIV